MSIEEKLSEDGELICNGRFQFITVEEKGDREEKQDETAFRCKGAPAMAIKESGVGGTGVCQGYIDLKLVQKEEYKDKIPTLVIRKWVTTSIMLPNPFDVADAELAASRATNPEDAPRLANTFAF